MTDYTIEAENMVLDGYTAQNNSSDASGGGYIETWGTGTATTTFQGEAGTYGIDLSVFDENDGQSTIELFINGESVSIVVLDQDADGNYIHGTLTNFSLLDVDLQPGDVIEIRSSANCGEAARLDKIELTRVVESTPVDPSTIGENVVLLHESFDGAASVESSDLYLGNGYAGTNGCWDGNLVFNDVNLEGKINGKLTVDLGIAQGGFEEWGTQGGDMLSIELVDQDGTVHVLDLFTGDCNTLTGTHSGQVLDGCYWKTFEYDIPEGVTSFKLMIQTSITSNCEVILLDNVKITADMLLDPVEPVLGLDAVDDEITVLETEGEGDTDINVLENDTSDFGPVNQVLRVEGQSANVGEWIDLADGGRVRIDENGDLDFDADGDFDFLNDGQTATVDLEYTIAEVETFAEEYQCLFFNEFAAGTVLTNQLADAGVRISSANSNNPVMIFDTANPTGGDGDLATSNLGKVLILSEDRDSSDPDDNAGGGTFIFDFDRPAVLEGMSFLDTEEPGAELRFFDADGNLITTVQGPPTPDGGQAFAQFDISGGARLEVQLQGSGAIDNLIYTLPGEETVIAEDTATVTINIEGLDDPNTAPEALDNQAETDEETAVWGNVITDDDGFGVDSDPEGDTLTVTAVSFGAVGVATTVTSEGGLDGVLVVNADGSYAYFPGAGFDVLQVGETDQLSFTYTISDGNGGTDTANVNITINGLNEPPVAVNDAITITEDDAIGPVADSNDNGSETVTLNVLDNDSDPNPDDVLTVQTAGGVDAGNSFSVVTADGRTVDVVVGSDGTVSFDTAGQFDDLNTGDEDIVSFSYTVTDGNGATDAAHVDITLLGDGGGKDEPANSINVVFVVDASRSNTDAGGANAFFASLGLADTDIDGDGLASSQLDAQLFTLQKISDTFAASSETDIELSFILNADEAGTSGVAPEAYTNAGGQSVFAAGDDLSSTFAEIDQSATLNVAQIDLGLEAANTVLTDLSANDADTSDNYVILMSDNSPSLENALPGLTAAVNNLDAAFGDDLILDTLIFDPSATSGPFFQNLIVNNVADGSVERIHNQNDLNGYLAVLNDDLIA